MDFKLSNSNINNLDIGQKLNNKINFEDFDLNKGYDVSIEFYNKDLVDDSLNENVSYEIKRKHFLFIQEIRNFFKKNDIIINKCYLMGTILDLVEDEMNISILISDSNKISNIIWPCKEIFIYEDTKNKLDNLLYSNQISMEEYVSNLEDLKYELSIYESEEEHEYLN